MKNILNIYNRLNPTNGLDHKEDADSRLYQLYPEIFQQDDRVHLLYIQGFLNASGYYRTVSPIIEINKSSTHRAVLVNLDKWDYTKQFEDYDRPIDERLIQWADYIIWPSTVDDIRPVLHDIRAINPNVIMVMDVDKLIHEYPDYDPRKNNSTEQQLEMFLSNLQSMELVTTPAEFLLEHYEDLIARSFQYPKPEFALLPNLISHAQFSGIHSLKRNNTNKVRIGIVTSAAQAANVLSLKEVIGSILEKYRNQVQFVIFGWDGKLDGVTQLEGGGIAFEKATSILEYFEKINNLKFDLALIPSLENAYNYAKSSVQYAEFAAFGIPVIASDQPPYSDKIIHGENGFLIKNSEEWREQISLLIEDEKLRRLVGAYAFKYAWRNMAWNRFRLRVMTGLFD